RWHHGGGGARQAAHRPDRRRDGDHHLPDRGRSHDLRPPARRGERAAVIYAIVPAGGHGSRMGARRPKQFLRLGSAPILVATLRALARTRALRGIVLAVPEARVTATRRLLARARVPKILDVVAGGADRQESVWRGLQRVPEDAEIVVVHDAVRPFVTAQLVERVCAAAAGGA